MATTKLADELAGVGGRGGRTGRPRVGRRWSRPRDRLDGCVRLPLAAAQSLLADLQRSDGTVAEGGVVQYAGALSVAGRVLAWQMDRRWEDRPRSAPRS